MIFRSPTKKNKLRLRFVDAAFLGKELACSRYMCVKVIEQKVYSFYPCILSVISK